MLKNKSILAWAFYDWANSVFATVVIAGLFPVVFKQYWAANLDASESTFWLGTANSIASLLIVVMAPLLGAIADCAGIRKRMLLIFMALGVVFTALLYPVESGYWWLVLVFYVLATLGFMGGNIFYDAMIVDVSKGQHVDRVSGFGFAMGYLGGGILLAFSIYMSQSYESFGFSTSIDAVLFSFILAALWWWLFTIPLMIWVKESAAVSSPGLSHVFSETANTLKTVLRNPQIRLFLFAYWIYIDGVDTIIRMAVDYGLALGF
ncbi:MAG: MFS transporter, partial [Gammaproteobacteria bacterium]|nr:MFS transporter [Gammaproteobacteria bacterium]